MQAAGVSDIGKTRNQNQDSIFISTDPIGPLPNLFIVADGMGGHNAGDVASRQAISFFTDYIKNHTAQPSDFMDLCVSAAGYANHQVFSQAQKDPALTGMGTTFSACFIFDNHCKIVHIGDSRVYKIESGGLVQLTSDHSYVNEMIKAGYLTPEQAKDHPKRNILTRVMGVDMEAEVDGYTHNISEACSVLLCSDGLFGMLSDEMTLQAVLADETPQNRVQDLIDAANAAGGKDNISAIIIDI